MDPLSVTAGIIAILQLSVKVLGYLNDVKDASSDRARCAIEAASLNSLLTTLRFRLEDGDSGVPWHASVQTLGAKDGPLDQFKQALEQLQAKMTGGGKMKKVGEALVWKFKKEEIASILGRMERLKTLVQVALQMDHVKLSQAIKECADITYSNTEAIKDDTDFIRSRVPTMESGIDAIRYEVDLAKHGILIAWISPTEFPTQQSDLIDSRQEGTGQWFLNASEFTEWLGQPKKTLFCPGIPGAGKTIIAAIAVDHLLKTVQSNNIGVAYVYCNYKRQQQQDTASLLAAVLKQLVQAQPAIMEPVERLHKQHADRRTRPSIDEIFSALESTSRMLSTVCLVIDALDECPDGLQFLAKLRDLQARIDLRLMVTSRFIPNIVDKFKGAPVLEVRANEEDVKRFVSGQMYRVPKCIQRDTTLQEMAQSKIIEAADGMFLLARLHVDSLLDKRTPKEVKSTLAKLSKGSNALNQAYGEAIHRIEGQLSGDYERAKKVLSWIVYAQRPLTTAEICCALAVEPEEKELDLENVPDIEDLVSVCAGLVVVDQESLMLVHYTTQEYFERIMEDWNSSAKLDIALTCLTYLSFDTFKTGSCSTEREFMERIQQSKFLDYAAKHWGQHTLPVQDEACELAYSFLLHDGLISNVAQAMSVPGNKYRGFSQHYPRETTSLHLTAQLGLSSLLAKLLSRFGKKSVIMANMKDRYSQTPLYLATERGHHEIVKLLVDSGADVNAQGGTYGNALQAASSTGHEQIVKLLLDKGANINAQGGYNNGALQAASYYGYEQIVKLLIRKGADVNAQGGHFNNALQAASNNGYEQIVKLLVDNGTDVNAQGGTYGNALQAASRIGHKQIVKLLVDNGADVNAQGGYYGNTIQAASYNGHDQTVKLLVDNGADVNAQGGTYGNALQAASRTGHKQVVKLLVDNGADVNAQGGYFGNALQAASRNGDEQIVKLLLDKGANVNAQGGYFNNALQAAACKGFDEIVKLLLHKGADVNAQGGYYGNALQAASYHGHQQIVKLLISKGADINAQGGLYGNALYAASYKGFDQIVKLLLSKGVDVNARGLHCSNALQAASYNGHHQTVKLLVENGADINAQGGPYSNALQAASSTGHKQIVKLLVDNGADVNVQGGFYGNALLAASSRDS